VDRKLLREVVARIHPAMKGLSIPGYSQEEIKAVVDELEKNGVIQKVIGTELVPDSDSQTIKKGSIISVRESGNYFCGYMLWENKLNKLYNMNALGKDIN